MSYCDLKWNLPIRGLGYLSHLYSVTPNQSLARPELLTYWFLSHCNTLASKILFPKVRILPKGPWTSTTPEGLHGSCLYLLYFDQHYIEVKLPPLILSHYSPILITVLATLIIVYSCLIPLEEKYWVYSLNYVLNFSVYHTSQKYNSSERKKLNQVSGLP